MSPFGSPFSAYSFSLSLPFFPQLAAISLLEIVTTRTWDGKVQLTLEMFNSSQLSIKVQYGRRDGPVLSGPFPRKRCTELVCPGKWIQQRKAPA